MLLCLAPVWLLGTTWESYCLMTFLTLWARCARSIYRVILLCSFIILSLGFSTPILVLLLFLSLFRLLAEGLDLASSLLELLLMTNVRWFVFQGALLSNKTRPLNCFSSSWLILLEMQRRWALFQSFHAKCILRRVHLLFVEDLRQSRGRELFKQCPKCSLVLEVTFGNL